MQAEKELLEKYSLRVLRIVAKHVLPRPEFTSESSVVRNRLWKHYETFLHRASKEETAGALLPYMNSNAKKLLEETKIWEEIHPHKRMGKSHGYTLSAQLYVKNVQAPRRKALRKYMREHPEVVEQIREKYESGKKEKGTQTSGAGKSPVVEEV